MENCSLCSTSLDNYFVHQSRDFLSCSSCSLVSLSNKFILTTELEKKHYDCHTNDFEDKNYQKFLNRLKEPLINFLRKGVKGLDYGCGPGPTLSKLLSIDGFPCGYYDPYFFNKKEVLIKEGYDFLTCTEVIEHIKEARVGLERMVSLLKSGGYLALMTEFRPLDKEKLEKWWYILDPTHIRLYGEETFEWISKEFQLEIVYMKKNVVIFKK